MASASTDKVDSNGPVPVANKVNQNIINESILNAALLGRNEHDAEIANHFLDGVKVSLVIIKKDMSTSILMRSLQFFTVSTVLLDLMALGYLTMCVTLLTTMSILVCCSRTLEILWTKNVAYW